MKRMRLTSQWRSASLGTGSLNRGLFHCFILHNCCTILTSKPLNCCTCLDCVRTKAQTFIKQRGNSLNKDTNLESGREEVKTPPCLFWTTHLKINSKNTLAFITRLAKTRLASLGEGEITPPRLVNYLPWHNQGT